MDIVKKQRVRQIVKELNTCQVDFIELKEENHEYKLIKKRDCIELYCGSLDGCLCFLEGYKIKAYEHVTRLWRCKSRLSIR